MEARKINIVYGRLFPWYFQLVGILFIIGALALFNTNWIVSVVLIVIAGFILTGHEGTEIDPVAKTLREYQSFFFIRSGKSRRYNHIDRIFINGGKVSKTVYSAHTTMSQTFVADEYRAFLKLDSGEKIKLKTSTDRASLFSKMNAIARQLKTELVNATE